MEVPSVGDRPSRLVSQRMVGEILEPRARELFEMLRENLRHSGMLEVCAAGLVPPCGVQVVNGATGFSSTPFGAELNPCL